MSRVDRTSRRDSRGDPSAGGRAGSAPEATGPDAGTDAGPLAGAGGPTVDSDTGAGEAGSTRPLLTMSLTRDFPHPRM
jgi:hypothetical protein